MPGFLMQSRTDSETAQAAAAFNPLPINVTMPATQFAGCSTKATTWNNRVIQPAAWPVGQLRSSPEQIIRFFQDEHYTQGLAMVASWGGMGRTSKYIFGQHRSIDQIERLLRELARSIRVSQSVEDLWRRLAGRESYDQLHWTPVITSKTLHFMPIPGYRAEPTCGVASAMARASMSSSISSKTLFGSAMLFPIASRTITRPAPREANVCMSPAQWRPATRS